MLVSIFIGRDSMFDFHTHFIPQEVLAWLKENKQLVNANWVQEEAGKNEFLVVNGKWSFELKPEFYDIELYIKEQVKAGVTHSVISPVPQLFLYDFDPEITIEISQVYNEALVELSKKFPKQISALCTVPLNDSVQAARVLQETMQKGMKGVIIGPGINEKLLSDEFFFPLFAEANRLNAIVFIHPLLNNDPRIKKKKMPNLIGVPWETTVCALDIILSGIMDQFPNIRFLLAHGGGFLPYQIGRINQGYSMWKDVSSNLRFPPSEYMKRFWYDSVLWSPDSLELLVQIVGEDQIVPGSDYPFDLSVWPPEQKLVKGTSSLLHGKK